jgi:hypothetical protein
MNNENFHPILKEPPLAHALHQYNPDTRTLSYEYNGIDILKIVIPGNSEVGFRHGSDGSLNNMPSIQQLYVMVDEPVKAEVTFTLSCEALSMKPRRAGSEEAILGQTGQPLIKGVNGLYDRRQDLLIDWQGCDWDFNHPQMDQTAGDSVITMMVELGPMPWFINLRMHYYKHHHGFLEHRPWNWMPNTKPVSGWCSWEAFRRDVTDKDIASVSAFFSTHFKPYGLEYIQLDDGYENMPIPPREDQTVADGWLQTNGQFPGGHESVVSAIQSKGMRAGIWTNANVTNPEFAVLNSHYLLKDPHGQPLLGEWIDYLLDCREETLEKHVAPYYKGLKTLGYDYFKTDAIRHLLMDGLHEAVRQGLISNSDAYDRFRRFMACARENIGNDAYFLASWGVMAECVGLVDACRIAMDSNPTWAGIRMQLVESARWFHTQRILFLNDPDHICARAELEWTRSVTTLCALSGSLYMLSDPLEAYDSERIRIIQKTLPPLETYTAETGPLDLTMAAFTWTKLHGFAVPRETPVKAEKVQSEDALNMAGRYPTMTDHHPFSTLWSFHLNQNQSHWCILGRFATVPLSEAALPLQNVGLDPCKSYHVFDFWTQTYKGIIFETIGCAPLELGSCQVLSLREVYDHPQFIGSSRHVSSDAISIQQELWEKNHLNMAIKGIIETTETYFFYVPKAYRFTQITASHAEIAVQHHENHLEVQVHFLSDMSELCLQFN